MAKRQPNTEKPTEQVEPTAPETPETPAPAETQPEPEVRGNVITDEAPKRPPTAAENLAAQRAHQRAAVKTEGHPVFAYVGSCEAGHVVLHDVRFDEGAEVEVTKPALAAKLERNGHFRRVR